MAKAFRVGSAISFIALASITAGCAAPQAHVATGFGGKANGEVGLATRAMAALNSNDIPAAISFAEKAVQKTPNDAGFRALLGNAYFAGGRFQSAEGAYKDALTLYSNQPQVVLKLALVEIALGNNGEAIAFLDAGKDVLDPADYGLAVALAGHPSDAIPVLEAAARAPDADARVRQNLALAYALTGDWTNARAVAAQDVPADQLDARIQQWMQFASPKRASDQVASLLGVKPAAADPGQPVQLALNKGAANQALAAAAPAPQAQVAEAAPAPAAPPPPALPEAPAAQPATVAMAAVSAPQATPFVAPAPPPRAAAPKPVKLAKAQRAPAAAKRPLMREAAARRGNSTAVVQLGAFSNPKSVLAAWNSASHRYGALRAYAPMSARFVSAKGTFFRLSVHGFGSASEAEALCSSLHRAGATCFVRNVAGDTPVQIASAS
jgi:Flp pilus assembly protein TadD